MSAPEISGERALLNRIEPVLGGLFLASGLLALMHGVGWISLSGMLQLNLRVYYAIAAGWGWLSGNLYVQRRRRLPKRFRRPYLVLYLVAPLGVYALLWALGPPPMQRISPLLPLYALGVSSTLFLVPYLLRRWPAA